jgi:succinate dehydrogenase/fumarate reductase cytochrome b subunit
MNTQQQMKWIRSAHRLTGLLLIPLLGLKLLTGFNMVGKFELLAYENAAGIHLGAYVDIPLLFCFFFHGALGILRLMWPRLKKKMSGFIISITAATLLFLIALTFLYLV